MRLTPAGPAAVLRSAWAGLGRPGCPVVTRGPDRLPLPSLATWVSSSPSLACSGPTFPARPRTLMSHGLAGSPWGMEGPWPGGTGLPRPACLAPPYGRPQLPPQGTALVWGHSPQAPVWRLERCPSSGPPHCKGCSVEAHLVRAGPALWPPLVPEHTRQQVERCL